MPTFEVAPDQQPRTRLAYRPSIRALFGLFIPAGPNRSMQDAWHAEDKALITLHCHRCPFETFGVERNLTGRPFHVAQGYR